MAAPSSHPIVRVFFRGLGLLLPIALTVFLLAWLWNLLAETLVYRVDAAVAWLLGQLVPPGQDPDLVLPPGLRLGVSIVAVVVLVVVTGWWLGGFLGRRLFGAFERMLARIPVFSSIYPHVKQITEFFLGGGEQRKIEFAGVVAVPYPRAGLYSLGLLTGSSVRSINEAAGEDCVSVFIPTSPMPATGYTLFVPVGDLIPVPMSVDEALRVIMSGGVLVPERNRVRIELPARPGLPGTPEPPGEGSGPAAEETKEEP